MGAATSACAGAGKPPYPDRFDLTFAFFYIDFGRSEVQLDPAHAPIGARLDLADDLGMNITSQVFRVKSYYRFSRGSRVDIAWYQYKRTGTADLEHDVQFGETEFIAGTTVSSHHDLEVWKLAYTWSFHRETPVELMACFGLHLFDVDVGMTDVRMETSGSGSGLLPLPVVGMGIAYDISPRVQLKVQFDLFLLSIRDKFRGSFSDFLLALDWRVFRQVSLGGAFNRVEMSVEAQDHDLRGTFDTLYSGGLVYVSLRL